MNIESATEAQHYSRIPRARTAREVTAGFLRCREARVTLVSLACIWVATALLAGGPVWAPLVMLLGFCLWYLIEIPIHRWLLHMPLPSSERMARLIKRLHYAHHERPTDPALLFLPEWVSLPSIVIILGVATAFGVFREGLWFLSGFWMSLTLYEWMHYAVHSRWRPKSPMLRNTFDAHLRHHFRNEHYWFGVSNAFMDKLWGTAPPPESVAKSGKRGGSESCKTG